MSYLHSLLMTKERDREQIAQFALNKRATVSDWLRSRSWQKGHLRKLLKKELFARKKFEKLYFSYVFYSFSPFLCQRANCSYRSSLSCSFLKSDCERIAQVDLTKRATVSDLLRSLKTKERWQQFALFHELIILSLTKNERITRKPMSEFPTLD